MEFFLEKTLEKSKARAGLIKTKKGNIHTPIFMPVGTCASVKAVPQNILENEIQAEIILANTYHLFLRPGNEILKNCGGLSSFMNWKKPILTDSGGYQVYSLAKRRKISEEGVKFSSHIDGRECFFTPENVIDTQRIIGSDIVMPLDECTSYPCTYQYAKKSMQLTHRWLDRNLSQFKKTENEKNSYQVLFPIVQGSIYKDLRETSAKIISEKNQFGNAIGGVCHPNGMLFEVTNWITDILSEDKPRYMMGVGKPKDILECISLGVDMFDCVMPTRNARNGTIFTTKGSINIKNAKYKNDFSVIDDGLEDKFTSNFYSKAYLNHLFKSNEILGSYIASIQNLNFYLFLVKTARKKIIEGDFLSWKEKMIYIFDQKIE